MLLRTTLAYYDCTQPLVLQANASEYGIGTAFLQSNKPIAFASKMLTDVVTRYANIERILVLKSSVLMSMEDISYYRMITSLWR